MCTARSTNRRCLSRSDGVTDLAQVRYFKGQRQAGSAEEARTYWIASIRYTFTAPSTDPQVRRWNPLGFKVIDFRPEPELGAPLAPVGSASTVSGASSGPAGGP